MPDADPHAAVNWRLPDKLIARQLDVTKQAVNQQRHQRGYPQHDEFPVMPTTKHHVAVIRTVPREEPPGYCVSYLFAHQKPANSRDAYDDLRLIAYRDYGDWNTPISALVANMTKSRATPSKTSLVKPASPTSAG